MSTFQESGLSRPGPFGSTPAGRNQHLLLRLRWPCLIACGQHPREYAAPTRPSRAIPAINRLLSQVNTLRSPGSRNTRVRTDPLHTHLRATKLGRSRAFRVPLRGVGLLFQRKYQGSISGSDRQAWCSEGVDMWTTCDGSKIWSRGTGGLAFVWAGSWFSFQVEKRGLKGASETCGPVV